MKLRLLLVMVVALLFAGCATNGGLKTEIKPGTPIGTSPTPTGGLQAPSLVDAHIPVTDLDYQAALSNIGKSEPNRHNLEDFLTVAQYQYNHSNLADALKDYQRVLQVPGPSSQLDKVQYMVGQIYYDKKDYLPALAAFQNVFQKYPKSTYAGQSRQMMQFILGYSLGLDDLKSFVANYPDSPLNCFAMFQLGSKESQAGMQTAAVDHLRAYVQQCPQDTSVSAAQFLLQSLQGQLQGKTWKIAVFVPLTGKYKSYGQSVLNGVRLAQEQAGQSGLRSKTMTVEVVDTGSDGMQAAAKFQEANKDDSLDAIIGPVGPQDIQAVASLANEHKIALICPATSHDGLSSLGPYVFSNCMTNEMQGRVMARYAVEKLGFKRFGIMAPDDGEGQSRSEAFEKTVEALGGTLTASVTYTPYSTDFKKQILLLGGQDPSSSKENDRDNTRLLEVLKYNISKEIGKIMLKAKEAGFDPHGENAAIAPVPLVEGLTNTTCPSTVKAVNQAVRDFFQDKDFTVRNDDLIKQALTQLPEEAKGNTLPVGADNWRAVAEDAQASLLISGRVVETDKPNDWGTTPNWNISVEFFAYMVDAKGKFALIYQSKPTLSYKPFKPASLLRVSSSLQALYLPAHPQEIPLIVSQVHFYDLSPVFLGSHTWLGGTLLQDAAKDAEGSYFVTGFYPESQQGTARKFADDYLQKFALRPDLLAAQAFDATRLLLKAMDGSSSRDDIHNNLLQIKDFDGVTGKTSFGGHGEADKLVPVLQIKNGKYQQVQ